jgi:hypothetical protein
MSNKACITSNRNLREEMKVAKIAEQLLRMEGLKKSATLVMYDGQ